jgi:hypothetical protein
MNTQMALDYIPKRMQELGYGSAYHVQIQLLLVVADSTLTIEASKAIYLLVDNPTTITVESTTGIYDQTITHTNALQYEHTGTIKITNYTPILQRIRFIQIIPKN